MSSFKTVFLTVFISYELVIFAEKLENKTSQFLDWENGSQIFPKKIAACSIVSVKYRVTRKG